MKAAPSPSLAPLAIKVITDSYRVDHAVSALENAADRRKARSTQLVIGGAITSVALMIFFDLAFWMAFAIVLPFGTYGVYNMRKNTPKPDLTMLLEQLREVFNKQEIGVLAEVLGEAVQAIPGRAFDEDMDWLPGLMEQRQNGAFDDYHFVAQVCVKCPRAWWLAGRRVGRYHVAQCAALFPATRASS